MLGFHDLSASLSRPNFCDREIIQLSFLKCKVDHQQSPTVNRVSFKDSYHCQWQWAYIRVRSYMATRKGQGRPKKGVVNFKLVLLCCFKTLFKAGSTHQTQLGEYLQAKDK